MEDELDFSKGIPLNFFHLEDRKAEFLPLEEKLNFSLGRQTKFFKVYLLTLNFLPWKTKLLFERVLTETSKLLTRTHI